MSDQHAADDRDTGEDTRLDRELIELLNGLRVMLPGVQVFFAFLLTVPFTGRFASIDSTERAIYYVAFAATAVASVFLIAPSAQHRLRFRQHDKERLLVASNRFAIVGTLFLGIAVGAVTLLITRLLYGDAAAIAATAVVLILLVVVWYAGPLSRAIGDR